MFANEVLVDPADKERLVSLMKEANEILRKYPYRTDGNPYNVTNMSRAKVFAENTLEWCELLHVGENNAICATTRLSCSNCQPGPCDHRME